MIQLKGPTGRLIKGDVLDVSKKPFLRALQDLDPQLYVRWNPRKRSGWGAWEIRRRPAEKSIVNRVEYNGATYTKIDYYENPFTCYIMEAKFLNYDIIRKLREMDTWNKDHILNDIDTLEQREEAQKAQIKANARAALTYALKQNRTAMRDLKQMIVDGLNPHLIANEVGRLMSEGENK